MNHPDVHRQELLELLELLDLTDVWRATQLEAVEWFRTTHFEAQVELDQRRVAVRFPRPASNPVEVTVHWPDRTKTIATIDGVGGEIFAARRTARNRFDRAPTPEFWTATPAMLRSFHRPFTAPCRAGAPPRRRHTGILSH